MHKYLGITIGPIIDTLGKADKPASLWGSSYLFSYIMKKLYITFKDKYEIIVPTVGNELLEGNEKNEIGLFHDRIIIDMGSFEFNEFDKAIKQTKETIFNEIADDINIKCNIKTEDARSFLEEYIALYYLEYIGKFNLEKISDKLSALERIHPYVKKHQSYILENYFRNSCIKDSIMMKDASGEFKDSYLHKKGTENLKNIKDIACGLPDEKKKKTNNYYALVQADGDNLGAYLCTLPPDELKKASQLCMKYAKRAHKIIKDYHGVTIYAGGDDLLFLTPVQTFNKTKGKKQTIFDMISKLDEDFKKIVTDKLNLNNQKKPTMSYGVGIYFYKFPLYEAIKNAYPLLYKAKKGEKNSIVLCLKLHSGHDIKVTFDKSSDFYKIYKTMVEEYIQKPDDILNSVIPKLSTYSLLYRMALKNSDNSLENVFNNINNELSNDDKKKEYLLKIPLLIKTNYMNLIKDEVLKKSLLEVEAALRLLKFFGEEEIENE